MTSINRKILALAVPSIIANITTPLLGLVDTAITGHLGSDTYVAAIAVGGSMFNLMYWIFAFLRMGTTGLTAIESGRGTDTERAVILYRGLVVALSAAMLLLAASPFIADGLIWFLEPDAVVADMARRYFNIVIWGAPAVLCTYVLTGWFLGMQSSRLPMVISISINVVNIAVSPVLAFCFDMQLDGVAIGTLVAQWVGVIMGAVMCLHFYTLPRVTRRQLFNGADMWRFFSVNTDLILRTACLIIVTVWFTREGARQGEMVLAANALLMQFFLLFSYMVDGFAFAGEALIGNFTGADNATALKSCVRALMKWGAMLAIVYSIIYFLAGEALLGVLTDSNELRHVAADYLPWAVTVPLCGTLAFIWDGIYIGRTATRGMLLAMFVAMVTFFALYYSLQPRLGNHALWIAFLAYLMVRGVVQSILWHRYATLK